MCNQNSTGCPFSGICRSWTCCDNECSKQSDFVVPERKEETKPIVDEKKEDEDENDYNDNDNEIEEKPVINWAPLLKQLSEMGFINVKQNIQLLTKYHGNIDSTIAELVQLSQN